MGFEAAVGWAQKTLWTAALCSAPALIVALLVGLLVSIFQAVTQIHEMTLTFVPKLVAMALVFFITAGWILKMLVQFTIEVFGQLPNIGP